MTTPADVAKWMVEELQRSNYLYQDIAVMEIDAKFGSDFVYFNESGNLAISKAVLTHFRNLTEESVVWERGQRMWRQREAGDEPGRLQRY